MELPLKLADSISEVYADGALLARVFDNLLINAIRHAKEGRIIDIETEPWHDMVRISVITHSNPVPPDELERIFDKLYRIDKSRDTRTGGKGLGLSISRRIIELHDGTLTARQTVDGTAFDIYLPKQRKTS
jgi:signal transduction histidine kinase